MLRRHLILLAGLCGALLLAAPSQAIIGGDADTAHPYVGLVASGGSVCSGSLVSPTVFLTAAHCIEEAEVQVRFGNSVSPATPFTTGAAFIHPSYCMGCGIVVDHDLAVVVLGAPVAMPVYGTLPAENATATRPHKAGLTIVGYGVSLFWRGLPVSFYGRLAADVETRNAEELAANFLKLKSKKDGAACLGDSGGPNFLPGTHTIVAVTSFSATTHCTAASYSYRLDTAAARAFLDDFLTLP